MQCPHCQAEISDKQHTFALGEDQDGTWQIASSRCTACNRLIVSLVEGGGTSYPVRPVSSCRPRLPEDVPQEFAAEYHSACQILPHSPEASAAVSRRLLHGFLARQTAAGQGPLDEQIRTLSVSSDLPPYLKDALLALAGVARLDPGSPKTLHPEMLMEVEPGEPEWLLDVLQPLFELYFVQPARLRRRQNALEERIGPLPEPPAVPAPQPLGGVAVEAAQQRDTALGSETTGGPAAAAESTEAAFEPVAEVAAAAERGPVAQPDLEPAAAPEPTPAPETEAVVETAAAPEPVTGAAEPEAGQTDTGSTQTPGEPASKAPSEAVTKTAAAPSEAVTKTAAATTHRAAKAKAEAVTTSSEEQGDEPAPQLLAEIPPDPVAGATGEATAALLAELPAEKPAKPSKDSSSKPLIPHTLRHFRKPAAEKDSEQPLPPSAR